MDLFWPGKYLAQSYVTLGQLCINSHCQGAFTHAYKRGESPSPWVLLSCLSGLVSFLAEMGIAPMKIFFFLKFQEDLGYHVLFS